MLFDTTTEATFFATANYGYDELGNLVRDKQEKIQSIAWTVYGKIKSVTRESTSTAPDLEFGYDASGNRLWKKVKPKPLSSSTEKIYYYLRDAQGNEMARYVKYEHSTNGTTYELEEHSIYGSSRIGVDQRKEVLYTSAAAVGADFEYTHRELGAKSFELANHLGNVLVTVTDKLVYKASGSTVDYFEAEITSIIDYYPFGSVMQGRFYASTAYRYGFNSKEKETDGTTDNYDFGARIYDGRLGRWLSVDPKAHKFAYFSVYVGFGNNPVLYTDVIGEEIVISNKPPEFTGPAHPTSSGELAQTDFNANIELDINAAKATLTLTTTIVYSSRANEIWGMNYASKEYCEVHEGIHISRDVIAANSEYKYSTTLFGKEVDETGQLDKIGENILNKYLIPMSQEYKKDYDDKTLKLQNEFTNKVTKGEIISGTPEYESAYNSYKAEKSKIKNEYDINMQNLHSERVRIQDELLKLFTEKADELNIHESSKGFKGVNDEAAEKMSAPAALYQRGRAELKDGKTVLKNDDAH